MLWRLDSLVKPCPCGRRATLDEAAFFRVVGPCRMAAGRPFRLPAGKAVTVYLFFPPQFRDELLKAFATAERVEVGVFLHVRHVLVALARCIAADQLSLARGLDRVAEIG